MKWQLFFYQKAKCCKICKNSLLVVVEGTFQVLQLHFKKKIRRVAATVIVIVLKSLYYTQIVKIGCFESFGFFIHLWL